MKADKSLVPLLFAIPLGFLLGTAVIGAAEDFEPAGPNDPSITLSDFRMEFPYTDPVDPKAEPDATAVGLSFDQDWTVESYPGEVACRIEVLDAEGAVLGADMVSVGSLVPHVEAGDPNLPITVDSGAQPAAARAECSAGRQVPEGAGYSFSDLSVQISPGGSPRLVADVEWMSSEYPGVGDCRATFTQDGAELPPVDFTLEAPAGKNVIGLLTDRYAQAAPVGVTCKAFVG
jgi:hypothetical protein